MRLSFFALAASLGLATANPVQRGSGCAAEPIGASGYVNSPDTATTFENNPAYRNAAYGAALPPGYDLVFQNLNASNNAPGYIWYERINSYNPSQCAQRCNSINGCVSFNTYFERDPTVNPGPGCTNPSSYTYIVCAYWSSAISTANANNYGQYREQFQVVIAGANGYVNQTYQISQAASIIATSSLQSYCSALLHYTQPVSTDVVVKTSQPVTAITATSTVTTNVVYQTQFATVTVTSTSTSAVAFNKRAEASYVVTAGLNGLPRLVKAVQSVTTQAANATTQSPEKRAATSAAAGVVYTPPGLVTFPASVVSLACSEEVKPATSTIITYTTTTTVEPVQTSTIIVDTTVVVTSNVQDTATATVVVPEPTPQCSQGSTFVIGVSNSGTPADGHYIRGIAEDSYDLIAGGTAQDFGTVSFTIASDGTLMTTDGYFIEAATGYGITAPVIYASQSGTYGPSLSCSVGSNNVIGCDASGVGSVFSFVLQNLEGNDFYDLQIGPNGGGEAAATLTAVC